MKPRVSLIVTSYNYAPFLTQTIDSALAQTYPSVEVVVVDDGSTDASPDIIRSYGDRVIAIFAANGGQAAAENAGFAASSGEIVLFLDADDYLYPDAIDAVVEAWRPGAAKVQFYLDAVDKAGDGLGFRLPNLPMSDDDVMPLIERYGYYPSPPTSGNAYARAMLDRVLPMCGSTWRRGPDGLLNALAALYGPIATIHRSLGAYRIHGRNMYAGALDVVMLRANVKNELDRETAIKEHARRLGQPITGGLCLTIPAHCKARLISLKLDPEHHQPSDDTLIGLAWAGVRACWRFPHLSAKKRFIASVIFLLLPTMPRSLLARTLEPLFRDNMRRASWSTLLPSPASLNRLLGRGPVLSLEPTGDAAVTTRPAGENART
jgi:glycosyltransferase involved in cell wall biosynthesis